MGTTSMNVDMLAAARSAQWSADTFLGAGSLKLVAPAKINLFLGVEGQLENDYHQVTNIMHAVSLHDVMYAHHEPLSASELERLKLETKEDAPQSAWAGPERTILVSIDCADKTETEPEKALVIPACDNLVFKAIDLLANSLGRTEAARVRVRLEKSIPHQAGLGGGSSDAAAMLVALARWWGLAEDDPALLGVARKLGADTAFFLQGACALYDGAGENRVRSLEPAKVPLVLVKPPMGVSTAEAYRQFDAQCTQLPEKLKQAACSSVRAVDVPLYNNLTEAAEHLAPELAEVRAWLLEQPGVEFGADWRAAGADVAPEPADAAAPAPVGAPPEPAAGAVAAAALASPVLLCGSGATTAAFTSDFASACAIASAAQARGWWARATTLSSLRAAVVPQR